MIKEYKLKLELSDEMELAVLNEQLATLLNGIPISVDTESGTIVSIGKYLVTASKILLTDGKDEVLKGY